MDGREGSGRLSEHADCCVYIEIGDEFAGPKTKGYIGSIATIAMLGLKLAVQNEKIEEKEKQDLEKRMLDTSDQIPDIAERAWALVPRECREFEKMPALDCAWI